MFSSSHAFADLCEELEVLLLSGQQRISLEVRDDSTDDQCEISCFPLERSIASVWPQGSPVEVLSYCIQNFAAVAVLADRDAGSHFPTDEKCRPRRYRD